MMDWEVSGSETGMTCINIIGILNKCVNPAKCYPNCRCEPRTAHIIASALSKPLVTIICKHYCIHTNSTSVKRVDPQ